MKRNLYLGIGLLSLTLLLTACGGTGELTVTEPWARPALAEGNGAVYFMIENDSGIDDILLSAETDAAEVAEMHKVVMVSPGETDESDMAHDENHDAEDHAEHLTDPDHEHDESHGEHDAGAEDAMATDDMIMKMVPQENVPVAHGETVEFKPGSYHVMLVNLSNDLVAGDVITVTLYFENAGSITLEVTVEFR